MPIKWTERRLPGVPPPAHTASSRPSRVPSLLPFVALRSSPPIHWRQSNSTTSAPFPARLRASATAAEFASGPPSPGKSSTR
eukprot:scaffold194394_cov30-Tisochrysis_lutea.AAC.1